MTNFDTYLIKRHLRNILTDVYSKLIRIGYTPSFTIKNSIYLI